MQAKILYTGCKYLDSQLNIYILEEKYYAYAYFVSLAEVRKIKIK